VNRQKIEAIAIVAILALTALATVLLWADHEHEAAPAPVEHQQTAPAKPSTAPATVPALPISHLCDTKPNLAILEADWCGPCWRVSKEVVPTLLADPALSIVIIDVDLQPDVAAKLIKPKDHSLPQFVHVETVGSEIRPVDWLLGYQPPKAVQAFVSPKPKPAVASEPQPVKSSQPAACKPCVGPLQRLFTRRPRGPRQPRVAPAERQAARPST
jgi:hypothetical protein